MTPIQVQAAYRGEFECGVIPCTCTNNAPLLWGPLQNRGKGIIINLWVPTITPSGPLNLQVLVQDNEGNFYAIYDSANQLVKSPTTLILYPGVTFGGSTQIGTLVKSFSVVVPSQFWIQLAPVAVSGLITASVTMLRYASIP